MVASARGLGYGGFAFGKQTGEEHRGLYLSAGHGHLKIDGMEAPAANFERSEIIFAGANVGAHFAQRADDAFHGAFLQRGVSGQLRSERLPRKDAGQQAHGGAGVAGIESAARALQSAKTVAGDAGGGFDEL